MRLRRRREQNMEPVELFSLVKHDGPYEQWPSRTELLVERAKAGVSIPGYVIEAQYRCGPGYLLITSYDCPFEEANTFVLLGTDYSVLANTELGVPYGSFLLYASWPVSDCELCLHYYTRSFYTLAVCPPRGLFRRRYSLRLRDRGTGAGDARSEASVHELEVRLADIRGKSEEASEDRGAG